MKQEDNIVILEGLHVCKHAIRFGADVRELVTPNKKLLGEMLSKMAPDIQERILSCVIEVDEVQFSEYTDVPVRTPLAGKAVVPGYTQSLSHIKPIVLLENPRDLENIGAVVRVSAGMDCAAVITTGDIDPWHKNCLRGSQGLHYALPVLHEDKLMHNVRQDRTIVVFDESGQDLVTTNIPPDSILVFGSERQGVTKEMLDTAHVVVKIPQREGVSSYNLATSVAMGLYHVLGKTSV